MPFALIVIGIVLVTSAVRDTTGDLFALVKKDVTGKNSFAYWILSILAVGSIGYIQDLQKFSRVFLVLLIVVLVLNNKGFFKQFQSAVKG